MQSVSAQGNLLLRKYRSAWRLKAPHLLDGIFLPNAVYYTNPFKHPLRGVEEIRSYWHDKVGKQSHISFRVLHTTVFDQDFVFDWTAKFQRRDRALRYRLEGLMRWRIQRGRIIRLWEYYLVTTTPILERRIYKPRRGAAHKRSKQH
jgi:hypothetical protein